MAKSTLPGLSFAILASIGAVALAGPAAAQASQVGVTSATDGDPLGKPPSENERVLRIGIDVQANEVVTTHDNDRAHLVFLDGTLAHGRAQRPAHHRQVRLRPQQQDRRARDHRQQGPLPPGRRQDQQDQRDQHHHAVGHDRHPRRHHDLQCRTGEHDGELHLRAPHDSHRRGSDAERDAAGLAGDRQFGRAAQPAQPAAAGRPDGGDQAARDRNHVGGGGPTGNADQKRADIRLLRHEYRRAAAASGNPPNTNNPNIINTITNSGGASNPQDATTTRP